MLTSSKPRTANPWPQLKTVKQEPLKIINVTGAKPSTSFTVRPQYESESECDADGSIPIPTPKQTFGDLLAMAFEKAPTSNDDKLEGSLSHSPFFFVMFNAYFFNFR